MIFSCAGKYQNIKKRIIVYGFGEWLSYRMGWFLCADNVVAFSDRDIQKKAEIEALGYNYVLPEKICEWEYDYLVITSVYYDVIANELCEKYAVPREKILSGVELWKEFENICDGTTEITFGNKHTDKIFYVIAPLGPWSKNGLINLVSKVYHNVCYALENHYLPIVDMKNFYTIYHEKGELGKKNIWEEYYLLRCVSVYSLDEVYESAHVIFCFANLAIEQAAMEKINFSRHQFYDYIDENTYIKQEIQSAYKQIFCEGYLNKRILGVAVRGGDYNLLKPKNHHIQPSLKQLKETIDAVMDEWKIDGIYVISDEQSSVDFMKSIYGTRILTYECPLYDAYAEKFNDKVSEKRGVIGQLRFQRKNDAFLRGKEYLISTMLLSYCNCFIGGMTSKTFFLRDDLKVKFENSLFIDIGKYL